MKLVRDFKAVVKNGKIAYTSGPVVPIPVKVKAIRLLPKDGPKGEDKHIQISHNGDVVLSGSAAAGEWVSFEKPLRLAVGKQIFRLVSKPYKDGDLYEGAVEMELSVF
ncbi:hypothetical protein [Pararhizobium gei]|uniref:hypothetical protein n=1 Tax=Pararhizobium gei TaxID=1395951 RepID=UPI0023DB55CA|nr:hypothetical protein [Rhizobium gei]